MQYHSFFEPYQLPTGEWTSLHSTWLRMPVPSSQKYTPWRLVCSHHVHDGGLRAQYEAYGEYRLSQQTQHIRELNANRFACPTPPCPCNATINVPEFWEGDYRASDEISQQWGDIGPTTRRRDRKRSFHPTRSCCNRQGSGFDTHLPHDIPPPRTERVRTQSGLRAPPHPPSRRPTQEQLTEAWGTYRRRCRSMCNPTRATTPGRQPLTFSSIPWPVFGAVTRLSDLNYSAIHSFLCAPDCGYDEQRARVKDALLIFHPDKSFSRWISQLRPEDVPVVQEALSIVTHHLTTILRSFQR
ncbi:hypothetical protein FRC09_016470 [Ceratobasidium sp. 395]|nr:hypothetical protein FRC09_016470 [Ceratobasidium sp. 395]